jgi:hypothetical protein
MNCVTVWTERDTYFSAWKIYQEHQRSVLLVPLDLNAKIKKVCLARRNNELGVPHQSKIAGTYERINGRKLGQESSALWRPMTMAHSSMATKAKCDSQF